MFSTKLKGLSSKQFSRAMWIFCLNFEETSPGAFQECAVSRQPFSRNHFAFLNNCTVYSIQCSPSWTFSSIHKSSSFSLFSANNLCFFDLYNLKSLKKLNPIIVHYHSIFDFTNCNPWFDSFKIFAINWSFIYRLPPMVWRKLSVASPAGQAIQKISAEMLINDVGLEWRISGLPKTL